MVSKVVVRKPEMKFCYPGAWMHPGITDYECNVGVMAAPMVRSLIWGMCSSVSLG